MKKPLYRVQVEMPAGLYETHFADFAGVLRALPGYLGVGKVKRLDRVVDSFEPLAAEEGEQLLTLINQLTECESTFRELTENPST